MFLFVFYLHFLGEDSPGGGFQAGVLGATIFIVFDISTKLHLNTHKEKVKTGVVLGVLIYYITGLLGVFANGEFLNYYNFGERFGQKIGIFTVETGVFMTVSCAICLMYLALKAQFYKGLCN
jgi:multicomponent Na+:H+ antiporter subunit B